MDLLLDNQPDTVELVDLFPTLVDACRLPMPPALEGTSLMPLFRGEVDAVKPAAFTQHPRPAYYEREPAKRPAAMGVSVRTDRIRYTEWRDWTTGETIARELYDHAADPTELNDLAKSRPEKLSELTTAWDQWARTNRVLPKTTAAPAP